MPDLADRIELATGRRPASLTAIGAGTSGSVIRAVFPDAATLVAKQARHDEADLTIEARGLRLLAARSKLPVPAVLAAEPDLLLMEDLPGSSARLDQAEDDAARLIAELHGVISPDGRFGLEWDGLIGPLPQPNGPSSSWVEFFRERRLLAMVAEAAREAALPLALAARLEVVAARLGEVLPDRPAASLLHGDLWSGNILARGERITGVLDPAPYYGHGEVELAFIRMFSTFGPGFVERYHAQRGNTADDRRGFDRRCAVYMLYPLLVHVRIYGPGYLSDLDSTLRSVGG